MYGCICCIEVLTSDVCDVWGKGSGARISLISEAEAAHSEGRSLFTLVITEDLLYCSVLLCVILCVSNVPALHPASSEGCRQDLQSWQKWGILLHSPECSPSVLRNPQSVPGPQEDLVSLGSFRNVQQLFLRCKGEEHYSLGKVTGWVGILRFWAFLFGSFLFSWLSLVWVLFFFLLLVKHRTLGATPNSGCPFWYSDLCL